MITFIVIGLMCNSLGCYWADEKDRLGVFADQQQCYQVAADLKRHSIMYFDTACMVNPR
jgi:hypothetical protein